MFETYKNYRVAPDGNFWIVVNHNGTMHGGYHTTEKSAIEYMQTL